MPLPLFARHVAAMMRGPLGVDVVMGGVCARGLFDEQGVISRDDIGERPLYERVLTLARETPRLAQETVVVVDSVSYVIRTPPLPIEDGGLVRYGLALVAPGDGEA